MGGRYGNSRKSGEEGRREKVPGETTGIGGAPLGNLEQCNSQEFLRVILANTANNGRHTALTGHLL